jgi:shikimate dehydrogenase
MARPERDHVLVGLIGEGIGRSLSPLLHQREADRQELRLIYTTIDSAERSLRAADLPELLRWAMLLGYRGLNVTHPFKQEVVPHLDQLSSEARAVGAVNTVVFENGRSIGYNTDWSGFIRGFERGFADAPRQHVVQLGAGGAGSAVAHGLLTVGTKHLTIVDVDAHRSARLTEALQGEFGVDRVASESTEDLSRILAGAQGVVNATPIGMAHHPGSPVSAADLRSDLWVADIVYRPTETELLRSARAIGAHTLNGVGMCLFQAVAAFEHFTGIAANVDAMHSDSLELLAAEI